MKGVVPARGAGKRYSGNSSCWWGGLGVQCMFLVGERAREIASSAINNDMRVSDDLAISGDPASAMTDSTLVGKKKAEKRVWYE